MKGKVFSTEDVQAILTMSKTQFLEDIKPQPDSRGLRTTNVQFEDWHGRKVKCPYKEGDILYVRETWDYIEDTAYDEWASNGGWFYKADYWGKSDYEGLTEGARFKSPVSMPIHAARIFLRVKSVGTFYKNDNWNWVVEFEQITKEEAGR